MKTQYKYLVLIFSAIFAVNTLNAQVTVGADIEPANYSMLQVEPTNGKTGVRMPWLSRSQIIALQEKIEQTSAKKEKAKGLMVYNANDNQLQYWNGIRWIGLKQYAPVLSVSGSNGLTALGGTDVQLGGTLTEATTVDLKDKTLSFPTTTGNFDIQGGAFSVNNGRVGINTTTPTTNLHIKSTDTGKAFRMTEADVPSSDKHVMMSDGTGRAYWTKPPVFSKIVPGTINNNTIITNFTTANASITPPSTISNVITLTEGKWIIMARASITCTQSGGYCSWLYLMEGTNIASVIIAAHARDGNYMATPELAMSVEVATGMTKQYQLRAGYDTNGAGTATIRTDFGGSSFIAVKLGD